VSETEESVKLDPNCAPTYAHMADAYFFLGFFGWLPPREVWGKLKDAATLAVQKDDRFAEGHKRPRSKQARGLFTGQAPLRQAFL